MMLKPCLVLVSVLSVASAGLRCTFGNFACSASCVALGQTSGVCDGEGDCHCSQRSIRRSMYYGSQEAATMALKTGGGAFDISYGNGSIDIRNILEDLGRMFYVADPYKTSYPDLNSLPKKSYVQHSVSYIFLMIFVEWTILIMKGKVPPLTDGLLNIVHGLFMTLMESMIGGSLFAAYLYIYTNYRVYDLPWDSMMTWILAALGVDFAYYWMHRAAHEVNILWAAHQVHHSSEEFNMTTGLRQSVFQQFGATLFYLPLALFVPPSHAVIHKELNALYQFWIHTELVNSLGPLDYILNTASHHKVHHGANRYCLDKNYAGVLIIWDRMFGTFEPEQKENQIIYGLVDQPQFWNPIKHQLFHYWKIFEKAKSTKTWYESLSAFLYGPSWFPGTPRLGNRTLVSEIPVREKYSPLVPWYLHLYTLTHFGLSFLASDTFIRTSSGLAPLHTVLIMMYILWSLSSIGLLYESHASAWLGELIRCLFTLVLITKVSGLFQISSYILGSMFTSSAFVSLCCFGYCSVRTNYGKHD